MLHNSAFFNKYSIYIQEYYRMQLIMGYDRVPYLFNGDIYSFLIYSLFLVLVIASPLKSTIIAPN